MKITILGKGGSGKTSITTMLTLFLQHTYKKVLAIDADLNAHLGEYIQVNKPDINLSDIFTFIKEYILGKELAQTAPDIGTIPPKSTYNFFNLQDLPNIIPQGVSKKENLLYMSVGSYQPKDIGKGCFHGKLNSLELLLNYLNTKEDELVIVDSTAGIDIVATSLYFTSDIYFFVIEPTNKSIKTYQDYLKTIKDKPVFQNLKIIPIINKVETPNDLAFVVKELNTDVYFEIKLADDFRQFEQGDHKKIEKIIADNLTELEKAKNYIKKQPNLNQSWLWSNINHTFQDECKAWVSNTYQQDFSHLIN